MKTKIFYVFLILGILLGPIYSLALFNQYFSDPLMYNYPYYNENTHTTFLKENKVYLGSPSFSYDRTVTMVNHTIYALIHPSQIATNYSFQNYADNGSQELLELNLSSDFNSIQSSKTYLLPNFEAQPGTSINPLFSRPFSDGNLFWTMYNPQTLIQNPVSTSFISFDKQGVIYSNQSYNFLRILNMTKSQFFFINLEFVGMYQNYFIVGFPENKSLLLIPKDNFNETRLIPFQNIIDNNPGFKINENFLNIDNNGLIWDLGVLNSKSYILGLSLSDIIKNGTSSVKEIINENNVYYPDLLANGSSFDNINRNFISSDYTFTIIYNGRVVSLDYLAFGNGDGRVIDVLGGIDLNGLIKQEITPFDISIVLSGYLLVISEGIIVINQFRKKNRYDT